jgi:cysteine desulfurase family protein (TIGR01976 family)
MSLDLDIIRKQFPALDRPAIFLDNPGGTQIARQSLDRMVAYLVDCNANHGGHFATSRASDAILDQARAEMAAFLNAAEPEEIVLGPNMTSLTFRIGRALAPTFQPGETIVVTRLDHDANVSPWTRLAEDRGMDVRVVDFDPETGLLDMDDMRAALETGPRLVAVGYASNALGTVNPVRKITQMAHEAGALVYVDAVQYAPHGPIDVQNLGCDFLACSAYKFFGPHLGILYGRRDLLESLRAYRVRPAPADSPGKFETGTNNHEGIAGLLGALEYLAWVGETFGGELRDLFSEDYEGRALIYKQAMSAIRSYEYEVSRQFLEELGSVPGLRLYGPDEPRQLDQRVPTFSFTLEGCPAEDVARRLDEHNIYTWDGNFYAVNVTERLGLEHPGGGLVRAGAAHYNTLEEVQQLGAALRQIAS